MDGAGKQQTLIEVEYVLNGARIRTSVPTKRRLLDHLREDRKLLSVKEGCGEGECGACTVLMDGKPVCSCLLIVPQIHGREIITLEGIFTPEGLHPVQQAFMDAGAVQCGFCTPGMILASKALLDENASPTEDEIRIALSGNLCRCTGYAKIIEAVDMAARTIQREWDE